MKKKVRPKKSADDADMRCLLLEAHGFTVFMLVSENQPCNNKSYPTYMTMDACKRCFYCA